VGRQYSEEVTVTSGVPQGSVLGPLLWRNFESNSRLFADDCILYRKILNIKGVEILQTDLDRQRVSAVGNDMKINPSKSKAISFLRARVKDTLHNTTLGDQNIPGAN
jgi:hypothetical protein